MNKKQTTKKPLKISIKILQKNNVKSTRQINKPNKKFYSYNRTLKAYVKKSKPEIHQIKIKSLQIKREKIKLKREKIILRKEKRKYKKAEKILEPSIKKAKEELKKAEEIEEVEEIEEAEEAEEAEEIKPVKKGYYLTTFACSCLVSDRRVEHTVALREEVKYMFAEIHDDNYPDHTLIDAEETSTTYHEYTNRPDVKTKVSTRQKEFLKRIGYTDDEIKLIKDKKEASKLISLR